MGTGHDRLISMARAKTGKAASAPDGFEIDQEGVDKLSGMLEKMASEGARLAPEVAHDLEDAIAGVGSKLEKVANVNEGSKALLTKTAEVVRILKKQNSYLVDELATHMQKESVSKFARELVSRGICTEAELSEMVEKMMKVGNLDAVRQALDIVDKPKRELPIGQVEKQGASVGGADKRYTEDPAVQFLMEHSA